MEENSVSPVAQQARECQLHLLLDPELKAFLQAKAKERGVTVANYCRQELSKQRTKEDAVLKEIQVFVSRIYDMLRQQQSPK